MENIARYPAIEDLALIGDGRACALLDRSATICWLCLPMVSSPAVFGSLLDARRGGHLATRPAGRFTSRRRYLPETAVLETVFETQAGTLRITDCMPAGSDPESGLHPQREFLRLIECLSGTVELEVSIVPRPDYSRVTPVPKRVPGLGWLMKWSACVLNISSDLDLHRQKPGELGGRFSLRQGERRALNLGFVADEIAVVPPVASTARRIRQTAGWWRGWCATLAYDGPHREAVTRSAITIKLLTFALSGAVVAAPTTSLPEIRNGGHNWDYRYCWLRDAALTLQSFFNLGLTQEGERFFGWLMHASQRTRPRLNVLYDVYGRGPPDERALELEGWRGHKPVRNGNRAIDQLQLDVYGAVIHAAHSFCRAGEHIGYFDQRVLLSFGRSICDLWAKPENGIWELSGRHHSTLGMATCWVGLDLLRRLAEDGELPHVPKQFAHTQKRIRDAVDRLGYNSRLGVYTARLTGTEPDASLLLLSRYGYIAPDEPRMVATAHFIEEHLADGCLLYRFLPETGELEGREGAFGICSFWRAEYWAQAGELEKAEGLFEGLLSYANDLGLYAEEIEPGTGAHLGNFPQAYTHVGLIDAAFALRRGGKAETRRRKAAE